MGEAYHPDVPARKATAEDYKRAADDLMERIYALGDEKTMRQIILAKSAGFCYGVRRAVELAQQQPGQGTPCVMLGPIIHNRT